MRARRTTFALGVAFALFAAMAAPLCLADPAGDLAELLDSVEEVMAAGAPTDAAAEETARLRHVAHSERQAPADMLRHLATLLEQANHPQVSREPEVRQEVLAHAALELDRIRQWQARSSVSSPTTPEAVAPGNDLCAGAIAVAEGVVAGTTLGAGAEGSSHCGADTSPDVWYTFTANVDAPMIFETANSSFDSILSLHSACPDAEDDHTLLCSDQGCNSWEPVNLYSIETGETVWLRVAGSQGADTGIFDLRVEIVDSGITGTVTRQDDGSPVADALVAAYGDRFSYTTGASILTAVDGSYALGPLPDGDWFLRATARDLVGQRWPGIDCYRCGGLSTGDPISLDDNVVSGIDFALRAGGAVSGRVTRQEDGSPAAATIAVGAERRVTEEDGTYYVGGLPSDGVYALAHGHSNLASEVWSGIDCASDCDAMAGSPIVVDDGVTATDVDFSLRPLGTITGFVARAADGQPVAATVRAYELANSIWSGYELANSIWSGYEWTTTDPADGSYRLEGLLDQQYFLVASSPGLLSELYRETPCPVEDCPTEEATLISLNLGTQVSGVDFTLADLSTLSGRVTAADTGLPIQATVQLRPHDDFPIVYQDTVDGWYQFADLQPGAYQVRASEAHNPDTPHVYEAQAYDDIGCGLGCDFRVGDLFHLEIASDARLDFVLNRCSAPSYVDLAYPFSAPREYEACREITVSTAVSGSGELILRAGRSVSFHNGFSLGPGVGLVVEIDPDIASD